MCGWQSRKPRRCSTGAASLFARAHHMTWSALCKIYKFVCKIVFFYVRPMCCRTQTRYGYGQWRPNDGVSRTLTASVAVCSKRKKTQKQNHNFIVFCSPFPETVRAESFCFCLFCLFFLSFFFLFFSRIRVFVSPFWYFQFKLPLRANLSSECYLL